MLLVCVLCIGFCEYRSRTLFLLADVHYVLREASVIISPGYRTSVVRQSVVTSHTGNVTSFDVNVRALMQISSLYPGIVSLYVGDWVFQYVAAAVESTDKLCPLIGF